MIPLDFGRYTVIGILLGLGGCVATTPVDIMWTHPDRDLTAYYRADAQCLQQANRVLFNQLETTEAQRSGKSAVAKITAKDFSGQLCKTTEQRDQIHYYCMVKKGWKPEKK